MDPSQAIILILSSTNCFQWRRVFKVVHWACSPQSGQLCRLAGVFSSTSGSEIVSVWLQVINNCGECLVPMLQRPLLIILDVLCLTSVFQRCATEVNYVTIYII